MGRKKTPRRKARSLSKRMAEEPIGTSKKEFKKLGPVGKILAASFIASAISVTWANQINALPVVGPWLRPVTGIGARIRSRMG
jgi:hypothetical protein